MVFKPFLKISGGGLLCFVAAYLEYYLSSAKGLLCVAVHDLCSLVLILYADIVKQEGFTF